MGFFTNYPQAYLDYNASVEKKLNVVFDMEGASDNYFSLTTTSKRANYGDPGLYYGNPGLVYGGGTKDSRALEYIMPDSSLQIAQTVEPEQGRGSVSTMSFSFIDLNGEVTRFFSPGQVVDEPLGNKLVKVRVGYSETSYPEDYFTIFRGYVSNIKSTPTKVNIQLSDPNAKRRAQIFYAAATTATADGAASDTVIPVDSTGDFAQQILGPNGSYDPGITTYINLNGEYCSYGPSPSDITDTTFTVVRGQRGTAPSDFTASDSVAAAIQITDNCINIALKTMLSGWDGPWLTNQAIQAIQTTSGGIIPNGLVLPYPLNAVEDLGLTIGDYVTVSNSSAGNDGTYIVSGISSVDNLPNNVILFETNFVAPESGVDGVKSAFRSKYDVYPPDICGMQLTPADIDVESMEYLRDVFFSGSEYVMNFLLSSPISGKQWIESQIFLPIGCYSITRLGKLTANLTLPPIGNANVQTLDVTNILNPQSMNIERAINTRRYFNEIQYQYDLDDAGDYLNTRIIIDSESLTNIAVTVVLPIPADGVKTANDASILIDRQGQLLIQRYKNACLYLECDVNWQTGSIIETGDTVIVNDNGTLYISNFQNGTRNLGSTLFEVIKCTKDVKAGKVSLGLLSNLQYLANDRFGTVSPSSYVVASDSSATSIKITPSFGEKYGESEYRKWTDAVGWNIAIHPTDYSSYYESKLIDASTENVLTVAPAFPVAPGAGWVVDIAKYPTSTDPNIDSYLKKVYAHFTPDIVVVSDISNAQFTVAATDADKFLIGNPIYYHSYDYSVISSETLISGIAGSTISVDPAFDVVPSGQGRVGLIGYLDGGKPYRYV